MSDRGEYLVPIDDPAALRDAADRVAELVFREDLSRPGFALLDLGTDLPPRRFREVLVALTAALADVYYQRFGRQLVYLALGRFDQQATTRAHRDGAPDESVLVLGYEPTEVASRLSLLDYTRCARDRGLTPRQFLDQLNPAFGDNESLLRDYTTEVGAFRMDHYQILIVNNSAVGPEGGRRGMLGVLHKAVVPQPRPDRPRHVNSLTLITAEAGAREGRTAEEVRAFVESAAVAR